MCDMMKIAIICAIGSSWTKSNAAEDRRILLFKGDFQASRGCGGGGLMGTTFDEQVCCGFSWEVHVVLANHNLYIFTISLCVNINPILTGRRIQVFAIAVLTLSRAASVHLNHYQV